MKTAIIFLGLTMMTFTSSIANNSSLSTNNTGTHCSLILEVEQGDAFESTPEFGDNKKVAPIDDQTVINPETILNMRYERDVQELIDQDKKIIESTFENSSIFAIQEQSIEEVITANNQITEDQIDTTVRPLYLERTIEDSILEDNLVIENELNNMTQPLDFNIINQVQTVLKKDKLLF
jgi:hypothetical protein